MRKYRKKRRARAKRRKGERTVRKTFSVKRKYWVNEKVK